MCRTSCSGIVAAALLSLLTLHSVTASQKVVVCYYPSWVHWNVGRAQFLPTNLDPQLCTHINFAFTSLKNNELIWEEGGYDPGTVAGIQKAVKAAGAKVFLSVGGGDPTVSPTFSAMARQKSRRAAFIQSAIKLLRKQGLQGLDLDWENPGTNGGSARYDKAKFSLLLAETRAAFAAEAAATKRPRLLLSVAVPSALAYYTASYDVPAINKAVDIINLMGYDYAGGTFSDATGHLAPLGGAHGVAAGVRQWLSAGASPAKTVLGIPTYWTAWTLRNAAQHGVGAAVKGPAPGGPYTHDNGTLAYYEVLALPGRRSYYDAGAQATYSVSGSVWASGETPGSAARKGRFIKDNGLAGAMFWELSQDAFQGKAFPLIRAVKAAMV